MLSISKVQSFGDYFLFLSDLNVVHQNNSNMLFDWLGIKNRHLINF